MRYSTVLFSLATTLVVAPRVDAAPIGLGDFSGSETVVSLASLPGPPEAVVTVGDLTFTSSANFLKQSGLTDTSTDGMFSMDLATPQQRVGLELNAFSVSTGGAAVTWSVKAFDAGLSFLEEVQLTQSAASVPVFGGIERTEGIARLEVAEVTPPPPTTNYFTFINEVRFEVPEPATATLLAVGLLGLLRRKAR